MLLGLLHWDRFGPDDPVTAGVKGPSYEDQAMRMNFLWMNYERLHFSDRGGEGVLGNIFSVTGS